MCNFFSFVTDPVHHPAEYYYLDWQYRKANLEEDDADSHLHICSHFKLNEDVCNKYEFNPLTRKFVIDQVNSGRNDSDAANKWAKRLDFKTVVDPLIVKPIPNLFKLPEVERVTDEQIDWLKSWDAVWTSVWASVGNAVRASVGDAVWTSVRYSVWASVWNSVGASVMDSVWASVRASVWVHVSTFFAIKYKYDFSPVIKLWEAGLVPTFDGTTWRLHSGKKADVVYEWKPD